MLFQKASKTIAELIYTSWVNAGSPELNPSVINEENTIHDFHLGKTIQIHLTQYNN